MGDAAGDFRLLRLESKRSRAVKREYGPKRLTEEGIPFDSTMTVHTSFCIVEGTRSIIGRGPGGGT